MKYEFNKMINGKGKRGRIEHTAFQKAEVNTMYISKRNKDTVLKASKLSDKIIQAFIDSKKYDFNIYYGKDGKDNILLGAFDNASIKGSNYIIVSGKNKEIENITATNINSHYLYLMMLAWNIFFQDKEAIKQYAALNFDDGMLDSDQAKQVFTLNDNIYWTAKNLDGLNIQDETNDNVDVKTVATQYVDCLESNITSLLSDNLATTNAALRIGIPNDIPLYVAPQAKSNNQKVDAKKDVLDKKYFIYKDVNELKEFPEDLVIRYKSGQEAFEKYAPTLDDEMFSLVRALKRMNVVCLTGEAGGGKTTIASAIAGCLGLPLVTINGNNDTDFASMILDYGAKDGSTFAIEKPALQAYIHGGLVVIDEITRIKGEMSTALNAMLDTRQYYDAPNGVQYKKNPNFKVICTMNQGAGYSTEELDTSLIDRFNIIKYVQDPKKELAVEIVSNATGFVNKDIVGKMWEVKTLIDNKAREEEAISRTSMRGVIDWINQAFITGEFVQSAIDTIVGKLILKDSSVYSQDVDYLENDCDNELIAYAVSEIKDFFEDEEVDFDDYIL